MAVAYKGAISFALVYIPVNLYTAVQDNDVRFNQLSKESKRRVRYKKNDEITGKELSNDEIVKGYQYDKNKYVVVTDEDFEKIKTNKDRNIQILQFADEREICPVYYDKPYYATPQKGGEKAFELLRLAMLDRGKVAIGHTVLGQNETMLTLIPADDGILMQTLLYEEEVKEIPRTASRPEVSGTELEMADKIIAGMEKRFEPKAFRNDYQKRLRQLIESKIEGREIAVPRESPGNNVISLMDALKASMELHGDDASSGKAKKMPRARKKTGS